MPVIDLDVPAFKPQSDYPIVKYLDLVKFISILQRNALFFCRLDKLEDQFEGTKPKLNSHSLANWFRVMQESGYFQDLMSENDISDKVNEINEHQNKLKALTCVNCWNKKKHESAALWKIYSGFDKGIMITSSIKKITESFENSQEKIFVSEIKYIDYDEDVIPEGNTMWPIIHKNIAYSYEEEVRLVFNVPIKNGWQYDWTKEEITEGLFITSNLNTLIDQVILSPFSPSWFYVLIEDLMKKYGLNKPISKSKLSRT